MTDQLSMWATPADDLGDAEAHKLARGSDPGTSHQAAREHVRSGQHGEQLHAVLKALRGQPGPVTSMELARAAGLDRYACARRLPDLVRAGDVEQGEARPCRVSGRAAVTWRVVR